MKLKSSSGPFTPPGQKTDPSYSPAPGAHTGLFSHQSFAPFWNPFFHHLLDKIHTSGKEDKTCKTVKPLPAELAAVCWQILQNSGQSRQMPMEKTDVDKEPSGGNTASLLPKQLIRACMPSLKQPSIFVLIALLHPMAKTSRKTNSDSYKGLSATHITHRQTHIITHIYVLVTGKITGI